ncbi:ATP-binding cassette domain-containing protein [Streptomyces alkaliphilus]|uniref:ATP-binding cassette domain-containing protein n=1 Tax=Streptomyces alkaliphilus TaxID=1472722 RepID=A0A7W3TGR6_9ACTN|nr:ABC transporter ATP-binding protein [Streptomyces alkaliphilus]MBB0246547.1 ATP-binding cassette domain-containing protein [Streptomyces alkaliphilus]
MTRAISLQDVSKVYPRSIPAVDRFSLDIAPGEFVVLLGPSGCGKSTVLRLIAGLEEPTSGEVLLDGESATGLSPGDRRLAMVFQHYALYPNMTGRGNMEFPLRMEHDGGGDHDRRIDSAAHMLGIRELLDRLPAQMSGGERQRVAMGRAIVRRPSTFLMDEPLSNLDAKLRNRLRAEIAALTHQLGVTTVYVTHDQAEAMSLGDRVVVMRDGVIQQTGPARDVYHLPNNVFVAAFVGTPRINLLRARVLAPLGGRMSLDFGSQKMLLPEPLSPDHQLLRIQMGRDLTVGLRSEAVRIAPTQAMRPSEAVLQGVVRHVEFQGHESLVHVGIGGEPADVGALEAPRRAGDRQRRNGSAPGALARLRRRSRSAPARHGASAGGVGTALDAPERPGPDHRGPAPVERIAADLVVRTSTEVQPRPGERVPLLIDLDRLYVFDTAGERICPVPTHVPGLDR